ncbi:MAG: hypothetical protein AB1714_29060 [Acidobacteriota bacterium]
MELVDAAQPIQPVATTEEQRQAVQMEGLPLSVRIAGVALVLNGIFLILERLLQPELMKGTGPTSSPAGALVSVVVGGFLVANRRRALGWARVMVILGLVIFGGWYAIDHDYVMMAAQTAYSGSLLLLLFGTPSVLRMSGAVAVLGLYFLIETASIVAPVAVARQVLFLQGEIVSDPAKIIAGRAAPYRVAIPGDDWYLRPEGRAKGDNPLADRWAINIRNGANLMIIVEQLPAGSTLDLGAFAGAVIENLKSASTRIEVVKNEPFQARQYGQFVHARIEVEGQKLEYYCGLYVAGRTAFQVVAFALQEDFSSVEAELREIIGSFGI